MAVAYGTPIDYGRNPKMLKLQEGGVPIFIDYEDNSNSQQLQSNKYPVGYLSSWLYSRKNSNFFESNSVISLVFP